jgi:hypothetical protein
MIDNDNGPRKILTYVMPRHFFSLAGWERTVTPISRAVETRKAWTDPMVEFLQTIRSG